MPFLQGSAGCPAQSLKDLNGSSEHRYQATQE